MTKTRAHRLGAASGDQRLGWLCVLLVVIWSGAATPADAEEVAESKSARAVSSEAGTPRPEIASDTPADTTEDHEVASGRNLERVASGRKSDRIFGVLPNYATVEGASAIGPITMRQMFVMTARNSFDPTVFTFVGVVAALGQGGGARYAPRYATAMADNAIGNFLTSAVLPSVLHQDPRYFERGEGGFLHRAGYALSRSVVTRSGSGQTRFNYSEIGGNAVAAGNLERLLRAERSNRRRNVDALGHAGAVGHAIE